LRWRRRKGSAVEFAKAGASQVVGVELKKSMLDVAREVCRDYPQIELQRKDMLKVEFGERFDIVLALAVLHKLVEIKKGLQLAARLAGKLLVLRLPKWAGDDGILRCKYNAEFWVNVPETLTKMGFVLERTEITKRNEPTQYWRRLK
jgi:trans-aconitate methyltransferase